MNMPVVIGVVVVMAVDEVVAVVEAEAEEEEEETEDDCGVSMLEAGEARASLMREHTW